ncbi:Ldh family oxidoreductase [Herminiimonas contaminans]|uniref:Ldh family oxidoreductase n=1 Tax=Herminiimonas contaminans TaxID=1111140 RepID=A0ABS0ESU4_9BURK|nr:Ldh family oxidoreductase [Herminiimonas contaminans]MBF8177925.1 Ldh family oxidoreductase [Herminiimonas contaminans]
MALLTIDQLTSVVTLALEKAGASPSAAAATAHALVAADAQGLASHGVSRVPQYTTFLRNGRTSTTAVPKITNSRGGACLIDAQSGMAYEACGLAIKTATARAREFGISCVGITNSNHFGAAAVHLRPLAEAGLVGLAFSNSPAAMPAWGGKTPLFGTNPIAAIFPRRGGESLVIDLALSEAARGKIMLAAKDGKPIPLGWAVDKDGKPTTDAKAALAGSMLPVGGVKGAMIALTVELLAIALTGSAFGFEADSFFSDEGNQPRLGQLFLAIDPGALAGSDVYFDRIETLLGMMLADEGVRLPGERRHGLATKAAQHGIEIPDALHAQIVELASRAS